MGAPPRSSSSSSRSGGSDNSDEMKEAAGDVVEALEALKDAIDEAIKDAKALSKKPDADDAKTLMKDIAKLDKLLKKASDASDDLKG